jgi:hypothetical protein
MSRTQTTIARIANPISRHAIPVFAIAILTATRIEAQAALGTPFIGPNVLSYQMAELSRSGGADLTRVYGLSYGRRFGGADNPTQYSMVLSGSARPFDDVEAGVADFAGRIAASHEVAAVPGLQVAASAGAEVMAWGDDVANTGRMLLTIPVTAGVSYDVSIAGATLSPFATASIARHDLRTYLDDVKQSSDAGWDARYSSGVSLRISHVVLTSTRIIGETAMPNKSRWSFSAGISY